MNPNLPQLVTRFVGYDVRPHPCPTPMEPRSFVQHHTLLEPAPFVPELRLHLASEVTPLWHATQDFLDRNDLPPPFWAFAWPGGLGLARFLLDHPEIVRDAVIADYGSGSGLVALAAARAGARRVFAIEPDPFARAAIELNAEANELPLTLCPASAMAVPDAAAVVLAGDVFYDAAVASASVASLRSATSHARVLIGDPGRSHLPSYLRPIASLEVPTLHDLESRERMRVGIYEL